MLLLWLLHIGTVVVFCNHNSLFLWSPRNTWFTVMFWKAIHVNLVCPGSCHLQETPIHIFIRHQHVFGFPSPNLAVEFADLLDSRGAAAKAGCINQESWCSGQKNGGPHDEIDRKIRAWKPSYGLGKVRYLQSPRPGAPEAAQAAQLCCGQNMAKWTSRRALQYLWFLMILLFNYRCFSRCITLWLWLT
jgi:hypothetical protein